MALFFLLTAPLCVAVFVDDKYEDPPACQLLQTGLSLKASRKQRSDWQAESNASVMNGVCFPNLTQDLVTPPIREVIAKYDEDGYCVFGKHGLWSSGCAVTRREHSAFHYVNQFKDYYPACWTWVGQPLLPFTSMTIGVWQSACAHIHWTLGFFQSTCCVFDFCLAKKCWRPAVCSFSAICGHFDNGVGNHGSGRCQFFEVLTSDLLCLLLGINTGFFPKAIIPLLPVDCFKHVLLTPSWIVHGCKSFCLQKSWGLSFRTWKF